MSDNQDALKCAEMLKTRNGNASGFGIGPVCDEAAVHIRRLIAENETKNALLRRVVEARGGSADLWAAIAAIREWMSTTGAQNETH